MNAGRGQRAVRGTARMNAYQDAKGNWIATRPITFPSGARGYETRVLIRTDGNFFHMEARREEAERLADEWSNQ